MFISRISIEQVAPPSLCRMNRSLGKIELGGNFFCFSFFFFKDNGITYMFRG